MASLYAVAERAALSAHTPWETQSSDPAACSRGRTSAPSKSRIPTLSELFLLVLIVGRTSVVIASTPKARSSMCWSSPSETSTPRLATLTLYNVPRYRTSAKWPSRMATFVSSMASPSRSDPGSSCPRASRPATAERALLISASSIRAAKARSVPPCREPRARKGRRAAPRLPADAPLSPVPAWPQRRMGGPYRRAGRDRGAHPPPRPLRGAGVKGVALRPAGARVAVEVKRMAVASLQGHFGKSGTQASQGTYCTANRRASHNANRAIP